MVSAKTLETPEEKPTPSRKAVLMVGSTGSGKTPLGQLLESEGLPGIRCLHFDFGEALRIALKHKNGQFTAAEYSVIENSLKTGALLENEHFPIAYKLLDYHLQEKGAGSDTLIILNGIPRHAGQAKAMNAVVDMRAVINLRCKPAVALERIQTNAGGDRDGRSDDTLEEVKRRIELFRNRTEPLLEYYDKTGVQSISLDVEAKTTAGDMHLKLKTHLHRMKL